MMVLNTARVQVIEPELVVGGEAVYVDDLYNYLVKWVPSKLNFKNYLLAINITRYWNNLKNSLFVAVAILLLSSV